MGEKFIKGGWVAQVELAAQSPWTWWTTLVQGVGDYVDVSTQLSQPGEVKNVAI